MAESSACSLSAFEAEASASSSAAVLYSGQLRSLLAFPGIADNHVRFFNGLFGSRQAWDAFFFVDVGDAAGDVDGVACDSRGLAPVMRALAPVAVQTWAPRRDGDVPIVRVAGYCEQGATDRRGCLTKNETDRFNKAYSNIKTRPEAVARIMRLKHHIYRAFELMSKHVDKRRGGQRYDLVARVRPDCWFDNQLTARGYDPFVEMTPLSPSVLNALARARVLVAPREWSWGGLNDRFAVGGFREMKLYADQYMHMQRGWPSAVAADGNERAQDCPGWIHSESFARCNLVRHGITFAQVRMGAHAVLRVRARALSLTTRARERLHAGAARHLPRTRRRPHAGARAHGGGRAPLVLVHHVADAGRARPVWCGCHRQAGARAQTHPGVELRRALWQAPQLVGDRTRPSVDGDGVCGQRVEVLRREAVPRSALVARRHHDWPSRVGVVSRVRSVQVAFPVAKQSATR